MLVGIDQDPVTGFFLLYLMVTLFCIIVYKLGFARKLPLLKSVVVYVVMIIGCLILTFFAIGLPIAEGLVCAAVFLGIYRFRLHRARKQEGKSVS
ncbi:YlaH-like family protein [Bacillus taeanensis]